MAYAPTDTPPTLTNRAVSGTAWSTISTVGRQILSILSVATVARLLGPETYGIMALANLLIVFILNFRDLGTGSAIIQRTTVSKRFLSSLFWVNFLLGLVMAGVIMGASPLMAKWFKAPLLVPILCVLASSFWVTSCGVVANSLLVRNMQFRALALVDLTAAVASYLVALILAYSGFGVWSLVFANVANSFTSTTGYYIASRWRPAREFDRGEVRSIAHYSLNLSGFGLVNYFARNADNIVVGKVLGEAPLGIYQMAYNLMLQPIQNISSVIAQATFPAFARIKEDNERFRQAYIRSCMLIALVTFPVIAGMGVVADPMIRAILGRKWIPAIVIFQILASVGLVQSIQTTVGQIYMAKGKTDWMFIWGIVSSVVYVGAFLIGVQYGTIGVAISYCIAYLGVLMVPGFVIPFRAIDLRFREFASALLPQLLITGSMVAVCLLWMNLLRLHGLENPWLLLLSTSALGAVVYAGALLFIWPPVMDNLEITLGHTNSPFIAGIFGRMQAVRRFGRN